MKLIFALLTCAVVYAAQAATVCITTSTTATFPPVCNVCPGYMITERIDAKGNKIASVRCPPNNKLVLELPPNCKVPKTNQQLTSFTPICR